MNCILALIAVSLVACSNASAEQFNSVVSQCWEGRDHPKMSACVRLRLTDSNAALKSIENEIRDSIAKNKETTYVKSVSLAFEANVQSFRRYRKDQCSFVFTLASVGNGPDDNQMACEVELNIARLEQLRAAFWWLKG